MITRIRDSCMSSNIKDHNERKNPTLIRSGPTATGAVALAGFWNFEQRCD